jgi:RimK family alpha-L-glutamate ligase
MRLAVLAARTGWHTQQLEQAAAARGHQAVVLPYEGLVATIGPDAALRSNGTDLDAMDLVLARIIPSGSLEQIVFRVDALHRLEDRGMRVINSPRAIERTVDKFWTSALLEQCGIATPETVVCERPEEAIQAFRKLQDVIVKPLFGSMGLGMVRVQDEEMAFRIFRTLEQIRAVYYLQRTVDHDGVDVRAFVIGGKLFAAIERRATGWRTNLARGAAAQAVKLSEDAKTLAVRAAAAVGAAYAGVDLVTDRDGRTHVLEVNGIPGWKGLQQATGLDVAGALIDYLSASSE